MYIARKLSKNIQNREYSRFDRNVSRRRSKVGLKKNMKIYLKIKT